MTFVWIASLAALALVLFAVCRHRNKWKSPSGSFPEEWRQALEGKVAFYAELSAEEKRRFEHKVQEFLLNFRITGAETSPDDVDRLLAASSAVIPVFRFKDWQYGNLDEVVIYGDSFNRRFEAAQDGSKVEGLLGSGPMEGKMFLSQRALREGFANERDKDNTAIHEFVHLIDKMDGSVDGIPEVLLERQYVIPWLDLIGRKIGEIKKGSSDINLYGATNRAEFLAVAGEYFFENPELLRERHPDTHEALQRVFGQGESTKGRSLLPGK